MTASTEVVSPIGGHVSMEDADEWIHEISLQMHVSHYRIQEFDKKTLEQWLGQKGEPSIDKP